MAGRRVLVAGCGHVGGRLASRLARAGADVWGLRRDASRVPPGVRPVAADLTRRDELRSAFGGLPDELDAVAFTVSPNGPTEQAYHAAYVDALRHLLEELDGRVRRVAFTSSTAVHAQDDGSWVDERSETAPRGFRGRLLLEGERLLLESVAEPVVVRLGGIYGPGRTRLIDRVRSGELVLPEPAPHSNRIHGDDAAGALEAVLAARSPERVFLGVDDEPARLSDVADWLADALSVPRPERSSEAPPRSRGGDKRCCNARLRAAGWEPRYPTFREGYAALLGLNRAPTAPRSPPRGTR